ncbi:Tectonin beta-propeller repeat-containing protein 1 [Toxocara canis]|uniref:Tectonin beta-propeller repeat-containing protein 1 n=1 Tax=Toxocara canis TaxID=6265 RepID=A0A0B2VQQ7_TOXCA|nr:Tectonin beta-propeller repeat-containing protein 1 [Toxocara canis]
MHSSGCLWGLDHNGRVQRLNASSDPQGDDYLDWINEAVFDGDHQQIKIHKIVATKEHVIALDRHGYCYLYVCPTHTSIRFLACTFENQRWYPGVGWSARTLPTDRSSFSDETGYLNQPFESFDLPSDGWKWEQPWMIDFNEQHFDKGGWQYAFNFGANAQFCNSQCATTFVRRRRWLRARRYTAFCRWVQVSIADSSELFVDICAGGFDMDTNSSCDLYSLFALSTDGGLFWRKGVQRNSPEGTEWIPVEPIPDDSEQDAYHELASISCSSSSGLLLAITWDGRFFFRVGITSSCRCGTAWKACPAPNGLPVVSAAMGRRALWLVSSSGKLWMASVQGAALGVSPDLSKCLSIDGYTSMGDGMCRISATRNDQVLGISQRNEQMFIRSGVRDDELGGQSWLQVVARDGSAGDVEIRWRQVDSANCTIISKRIPKHWIDKNFVPHDFSALSDLKSPWRQQIVELLDEQHELLWHVFQDVESSEPPRGTESWTKVAHVNALLDSWKSLNWLHSTAYISLRNHNDGSIRVDFRRGGSFQAELFQLLGAFAFCDSRWRNALEVHSSRNATLKLAFSSEDERDQWSDILQKAISRSIRTFPRLSERSFVWVIGEQCQPRTAILSVIDLIDNHAVQSLPLEKYRWIQQSGSFTSVSVGHEGIVWAVAQNGTAWVLSSGFDIMADDVDRGRELGLIQSDEKLEIVMETQKYSLLSGYSSFNGKAAGKYYAWSDASGTLHKSKSETRLPNKYWSWVDSDWILVPNESSENSEEGWRYAKKFGGDFTEEKGPVRRREWRRLRAMEMPAPWVRVDAPRLSSIYVQKSDSLPLFVWAVSTNGELLCRGGVSVKNPAGDFWAEACSDMRMVDVCASSSRCVWALTTKNTILACTVDHAADIACADWRTVETPSNADNLKQIEAGKASVWLLTDGGQLFLRIGICAANILGEYWYQACSDMRMVDVCASSSRCVWALTTKNTILACTVDHAADIACADWRTVETPSNADNLKQIEAGKASVWLLTDGGQLFLRIGICAANILGEYWYQLDNEEDIRAISVDKNDRLYAIIVSKSDKRHSTLVRNRNFDFVKQIYARRDDMVTDKAKNKEKHTIRVEWETGLKNLDCITVSVW